MAQELDRWLVTRGHTDHVNTRIQGSYGMTGDARDHGL